MEIPDQMRAPTALQTNMKERRKEKHHDQLPAHLHGLSARKTLKPQIPLMTFPVLQRWMNKYVAQALSFGRESLVFAALWCLDGC